MIDIIYGADPKQMVGAALFAFSAMRRTTEPIRFTPLLEKALRFRGLYKRPHEMRGEQMWDTISAAPMSTDFANSRFLAHWLSDSEFVLFCDGSDMLFLDDPFSLICLADRTKAVQVVKRNWEPTETLKMDGQAQTVYSRKGWSSVMLWNRFHPANNKLSIEMVNTLPGRDLHAFYWLEDDEIGDLPPRWNLMSDVDTLDTTVDRPGLVHFTKGLPVVDSHENDPWSAEWFRELRILDATRGGPRAVRAA